MIEHRWRYRKYNIILDHDQQFIKNESNKNLFNDDFDEIRSIIKELKEDNKRPMTESKHIKMEINEQRAFLNYLDEISFD